MCDRDDEDFVGELGEDDREGKPIHHETADIACVLRCLPRARVLTNEPNRVADRG